MAIGTAAAIGLGLAGAGGAIAGAIPKTSSVNAGDPTARENAGLSLQDKTLKGIEDLVKSGPNSQDVSSSVGASRGLAAMLDQYSQSGGLPGEEDVNAARGFSSQVFDPQRTALSQSFTQQNTEAERLAARLGRPVNDPVLQAKLRTGFMNQEAMLNSQQGAYGADLALRLPGQRIQMQGQRAEVLGQLATQAFQNRSALMSLGSGVANAERQFRLGTASRTNGGGVGDAISGAFAGLGTGLSFAQGFQGLRSGSLDPFAGMPSASPAPGLYDNIPKDFGVSFGQSAPGYGGFGGGGRSYSLGGR